jgi:gamma-glutamyltranspeptidase / glutathione hydrolase
MTGGRGVVAAGHPATAEAGMEVLRAGGNAADAAVAAACAAFTAEASLTAVGGGGFALVETPDGSAEVLDFFVASPGLGRSTDDLHSRQVLVAYLVPFRGTTQLFNIGPSSCAVPGMMPGLACLHERHGRLPLSQAVAPAVRLARSGAKLVSQQDYLHEILGGILTATPGMTEVFGPGGRLLHSGETIRLPGLAETLEQFGRDGASPFIDGDLAARMAAQQEAGGGLITPDDLAAYRVIVRRPVSLGYRQYDILSNPLPSSGGTLIAFTLGLLDRLAVARLSPEELALALTAAFEATDRARVELFDEGLREEGFAERFLSSRVLDHYAEHVIKSLDVSAPAPSGPLGPLPPPEAGGTTHISVIDAEGLTVSMTSSSGSGSGVVIDGTGIMMNNMGGEEDLNPGGAFSVPPGARLTSMMAPTVAREHGGAGRILALGSAGSARLRSAIVQTLVNGIDLGLLSQACVALPRLHVEDGTVQLEGGTKADVAAFLEERGRKVNLWPVIDLYFGGAQIAARCAPGTPQPFDGGGDPRRGGVALVDRGDDRPG